MGQLWAGQRPVEGSDGPIEPVALHRQDGEVFLGAHQRRDGVLEIIYERVGAQAVCMAGARWGCRAAGSVPARDHC